jgi:Tfp pilus assembly PilM family ATPase
MSTSGKKFATRFIGIEAGGEWLKIALIEGAGTAPTITRLHLSRVEDGLDGLSGVFPAAWKGFKAGKEPVIACLPRQLVTVRMIDLPSEDPAEIDDMVDLQVGKQTPYSRDEIVYDYKFLGSARPGYATVMLAIVQRSVVRQVYYAFEEAGLEVERVTVSTEAVANWSTKGRKAAGCTALLDVDSYFSDFMVIQDGAIVFSRSILAGADHLGDEHSVARLVKEVRNSLEVFRSEHSGGAVSGISISGVAGALPAVFEGLKSAGLKCSLVDAVKDLKRPPKTDSAASAGMKQVSMSALVGMSIAPGMLEFNLVPDSIAVRRNLMKKAYGLTGMGGLVMAVLVSLSLFASIRGFTRWDKLRRIKRDLAQTGMRADEVARMMDVVRQVRERKDPGRSTLGILLDLRKALEATGDLIKITTIDADAANGTFTFGGMADSTKDIRDLVKELEQGSRFKNVRESGTTSERAVKKYKFQVSGQLEVSN